MSPNDFMAPLKAKYLIQLRERRGEITSFLEFCEQGTLTEELYEDMRKKTHRLAGSAATYGFPWITNAARALEFAIQPGLESRQLVDLTKSLLRECDRALGSRNAEASE
jgi:HPt (histidine-containing phosphotransfer) domain-containing protein